MTIDPGISSVATTDVAAAIGPFMAKKAVDLQAQAIGQLLAAMPAPPAPNANPDHLGNRFDAFA